MIKHRLEKHQGKERNMWSRCSCQQVWDNYYKSYSLVLDHHAFKVTQELEGPNDILEAAQETFRVARQELEKRFMQIPLSIHLRETTPWMKRTKWGQIIAGLDASAIQDLTVPPRPEEQELSQVQVIFKGFVARAYENSSSAPAFVLKCITSHCKGIVKSNPTNTTITSESLEKYMVSWFKMLCPLLRKRDSLQQSHRTNLYRLCVCEILVRLLGCGPFVDSGHVH
jgi:hypothetical protein